MASFDTALVLMVITNDVLADHETNRQIIELIEDNRYTNGRPEDRRQLVQGILELALRQMAKSQHGHDLVVGLMAQLMDEARAESLARIELTTAGFTPEEINETLTEFPEVAAKYIRPSRAELDAGGPI